jgi:hypothetical protein
MKNGVTTAFADSAPKQSEPSPVDNIAAGLKQLADQGKTSAIKALFGGDGGTLDALNRAAERDGGATQLGDRYSSLRTDDIFAKHPTVDPVRHLKDSQPAAYFLLAALGGAQPAAELLVERNAKLQSAMESIAAAGAPDAARAKAESAQRLQDMATRMGLKKGADNAPVAVRPAA